MPLEKVAGTQVSLFVANADNQLVAYVNGIEVYNKTTVGDAPVNELRELTNLLRPGLNTLLLVGIDWGVSYHFAGYVQIDTIKRDFSVKAPGGMGKVWDLAIEIDYKKKP
jgi:hypothetical protein